MPAALWGRNAAASRRELRSRDGSCAHTALGGLARPLTTAGAYVGAYIDSAPPASTRTLGQSLPGGHRQPPPDSDTSSPNVHVWRVSAVPFLPGTPDGVNKRLHEWEEQ